MKVWRDMPETPMSKFVADFMERITYKRGWSAHVTAITDELGLSARLVLKHDEFSADDWREDSPRVVTVATQHFFCEEFDRPDDRIARSIRETIQAAELHEMNEWLRLDGVHVVEPHPELIRGRIDVSGDLPLDMEAPF